DYLLATAAEIPPIEVIGLDRPTPKTPTGSKGMAEGGVMGAIGALMSAVNDALQPFGVVADRQPLTPHYIRALLRSKTDATRPPPGTGKHGASAKGPAPTPNSARRNGSSWQHARGCLPLAAQ